MSTIVILGLILAAAVVLPETGTYLTPPAIARLLGVSVDRVTGWIRAGELRAIDVSERTSTRPRWRIRPDWLDAWEKSRMPCPPPPRRQTRRPTDVIDRY